MRPMDAGVATCTLSWPNRDHTAYLLDHMGERYTRTDYANQYAIVAELAKLGGGVFKRWRIF